MADGFKIVPLGFEQAKPLPSLHLQSVLFMPKSPFNLISISQLTRTLDCSVTFFSDSFLIQDQDMGKTIGTGRESRGLYYIQPTSSIACVATDSAETFHFRLGHPSLSKLQKMVPSLSNLKSLDCESCQLGKHVHSSFPNKAYHRAESLFSLVHSDIWGPSRVNSTLGFRYFVTFIDDYLRYIWLYFCLIVL